MQVNYGRIRDIIKALKSKYNVDSIYDISTKDKLDSLCNTLQLSWEQLDQLIADNPPVLRPIKGHAFEVIFDYLVHSSGFQIQTVGGDVDIDRIVNGKTLQLKTPYFAGTKGNIVQYKTHKTHGAKSELESMEYYHSVQDFPDYLVGLISYVPLRIIFLSKAELPRHPKDPNRIQSPFAVEWDTHPGLNAFEKINIKMPTEKIEHLVSTTKEKKEYLPISSKKIGVTTDVILNTILSESNFRIWDMNIRGFAREMSFKALLKSKGINYYKPGPLKSKRGDKADLAIRLQDNKYVFLQIKGVTANACRFDGLNSTVAIETQLTRGRVNDHPTQSRLYLITDFDYLVLCLEPPLTKLYHKELELDVEPKWEFFAIPVGELGTHPKYPHRLKSIQHKKYTEIKQYIINDNLLSAWSVMTENQKRLF